MIPRRHRGLKPKPRQISTSAMSDRPWFRINRDLLVYKAFYFFFLSGFGSIFPYLPVYFRQIGLPASQVGLLLGLRPIVQFASAPFWAIMADKYRKRKSVLVMSVLSWLIMTMALAFVEPTNEICEIRQGNDTHKHVVNYTKVKTGFFKRSLWHSAGADMRKGDERTQKPDLDVVPIHVDHSKRRFKTISSYGATLPSVASNTLNRTQLHLSKSGIISQERRLSHPRNTSHLSRRPVKQQQDIPSREGNSSSLKSSSSNRNVNEFLMSNSQRDRFYNKRVPTLKTRTNNTSQTATRQDLAPNSEQIKSKHLSRFYKNTNSPGENNRRKHFLKDRTQKVHGKHQLNSRKPGGKNVAKLPNITGGNFTSHLASPVKHIEKNDSSSIDKRRENKGGPPVVIEFSRIIIPHGIGKNTANAVNEDKGSSGHFDGPLVAENLTKFVSHENFSHSKRPPIKQVNSNMSETFTHISKRPTDNINKTRLLQLEEKLSKIIGFDPQRTINDNSGIVTDKGEIHNQLHISDTSIENQVFSNQSLPHRPILQIHVHSKTENSSREIDKLSKQEELHKSETKFVIDHVTIPAFDIPAINAKKTVKINNSDVKGSNDQRRGDDFPSGISVSGSGSSTLVSSAEHNTSDENRTFDDAPKEEIKTLTKIEGNESLINTTDNVSAIFQESDMQGDEEASKTTNNESLLQTVGNISGNSQTSVIAGNNEATGSNFMQESQATNIHLVGNSDSQLQIWMTNMLKTNPFELKRIFTILLVLVVVGEFLEAPSTTLADASLLEHLGEERRYYGKQRLWGSLGFGLSSFFVGVLLERSRHVVCGDQYTDYMICFCVFALLMISTLFISTTFKFKYKETDATRASVFSALCNIHYGSCLAAACFMGIGHGMSHSFLNWFLEDLGATKTLMGVAVICRSTLDLLTFFVAGSLIKAVGQIKIMICALISYGIAFTLYSLLNNPWWVLPIEMLVGCTYAASWSACTSYMAGAASSESVTTIQGTICSIK